MGLFRVGVFGPLLLFMALVALEDGPRRGVPAPGGFRFWEMRGRHTLRALYPKENIT